jgi:antagonist of KipI
MSIVFLTNSPLTTVQDLGRKHFRRFGINPNGAMDKTAVRLINILLGNDDRESVLEMHFPAPKILFEKTALIALGGADFGAKINEREIENWRPIYAEKGNVLSFSKKASGTRAYLAIRNGFETRPWLGSASTNLKAKIGGFEGRSLRQNDRLFFKNEGPAERTKTNYKISKSLLPRYSAHPTARAIAGAEFGLLAPESRIKFEARSFTVGHESDRMGYRLRGENLHLKERFELVSSAAGFGTIQLLPDGQMIVLMADHQTTGGYPRVAHIIDHDLPLAAQLGAGDKLNFKIVAVEEAENLMVGFEKDLNLLKTACRFLC